MNCRELDKPEVKLKYEKEMITERDYYNMLNTAKADGLAAGLAEGRAEGIAEGISRVAKNFQSGEEDAGIGNVC